MVALPMLPAPPVTSTRRPAMADSSRARCADMSWANKDVLRRVASLFKSRLKNSDPKSRERRSGILVIRNPRSFECSREPECLPSVEQSPMRGLAVTDTVSLQGDHFLEQSCKPCNRATWVQLKGEVMNQRTAGSPAFLWQRPSGPWTQKAFGHSIEPMRRDYRRIGPSQTIALDDVDLPAGQSLIGRGA